MMDIPTPFLFIFVISYESSTVQVEFIRLLNRPTTTKKQTHTHNHYCLLPFNRQNKNIIMLQVKWIEAFQTITVPGFLEHKTIFCRIAKCVSFVRFVL